MLTVGRCCAMLKGKRLWASDSTPLNDGGHGARGAGIFDRM
jgi:hypothetical protein